jgi:ligand-binding sensor domain-containing protein
MLRTPIVPRFRIAGAFHSTSILRLLAARDGTLWIATVNGLASWKDGKLAQYPELAGQFVYALLEDRSGSVWAGASTGTSGRLCEIKAGRAQCHGDDGSLGLGVIGLHEDRKGNLWSDSDLDFAGYGDAGNLQTG